MGTVDNLRVLHLVTAREVFFDQQIETLEEKGVDCTVCVVPGAEQIDGDMASRRGVKEYLQFFPRVRRELRRGEYDLIHANYGLTAPYAITQFRLPVVLTLWGSDVVGFDGLVTKACAWRCDAITVRSEEMRKLLGRDAHILPSGIDLERFRPIDQRTAREHVGWDLEGTHVLFPYSPEYERKNFPLAERVVERAETELGQQVSLQTISGVPHEAVVYYMNAADVLMLTSDHEGSPNTVKEAMACNLPVVSTAVGDVRERLDGVSPSRIGTSEKQLVDGLIEVIRADNRSNGRDAVRKVSWDRIGDRILELYQSVL
ncbi:glycosyltransferase [Natronorubrum texcoconense]|uniref:Glycosyltransferase involved in cell wall bisynthesis n=1 Tax=Natronorubrum texcoconense TaxID=1095776 RepID=A0A1G8U350_9EURY|nr:glycosyltransferase [Natronorubrum texcoconense]SDJ48256.1 Glycosyltransferase involved in cell wall bisynthesis [Natronorubrum texcoconense]